MKSKILIAALSILAALTVFGCEEKTKYITREDTPETPLGVYSVTGDGYVDIYWQTNNDGGLTDGYGIYRYSHNEGGQAVYIRRGTVNDSDIPYDYENGVRYGKFVDEDVTNGTTYWYAVAAYNVYGESALSDPDAYDTPRPQGDDVAYDFRQFPNSGGFDFSRARVVAADEDADVWFEYDPDLDAFFIWAANANTDIQPWGWADDISDINRGDPGNGNGWSEVGWLEIQPNYAYLVWTADNHFGCIWITATSTDDYKVYFNWSYQTDEGNDQLKRAPKVSPPHAANYGRRSGN